jgi:hypothetical protein
MFNDQIKKSPKKRVSAASKNSRVESFFKHFVAEANLTSYDEYKGRKKKYKKSKQKHEKILMIFK